MKKHRVPTSAILWAAAIIASALLGESRFLSLILLPSLACVALLTQRQATCLNRSELS